MLRALPWEGDNQWKKKMLNVLQRSPILFRNEYPRKKGEPWRSKRSPRKDPGFYTSGGKGKGQKTPDKKASNLARKKSETGEKKKKALTI